MLARFVRCGSSPLVGFLCELVVVSNGIAAPPTPHRGTTAKPAASPPATATTSPSAAPAPAPAPAAAAPAPKPADPKLTIGATLILYGYQPLFPGPKNSLEVYYANLLLDGSFGRYGFHLEPRIRDTKLRTFFPGTAWIEEGYAFADFGRLIVKVGKLYTRLGIFWDSSFYGNVQSFDGLKLAPDYGVSFEGRFGDSWGAALWAQFFVIDGRTNIAGEGRDTIAIPGAFRRNEAIVRFEPFLRLGRPTTLRLGISGEFLQADLPDGMRNVFRGAADATLSIETWNLYGEFLRQDGQTVIDFPYPAIPATATEPAIPGRASSHNNYVLLGTDVTYAGLTIHYNFSYVNYADVSVVEWISLPGLAYAINGNLSVLLDYVFWKRVAVEGTSLVDHSLNLAISAHL
jgi:hypothetical protein